MQQYEDKELQAKALERIPINILEFKAQKRMRALQHEIKKGLSEDINISIQELLLLELLKWFKESFFNWVDSPECDYCDSQTKFSHYSSDQSVLVDADRVEMHRCESCSKFTPFYRYNNLEILLETREGRCGEWANVFTLLCRSMGWETRYILDETDHVWTEVYSVAQKRWLHCDPCENMCDNPLVYECGWGKQLSYIIAFSNDDIQDVTWKYSSDHSKILRNRNKCTEKELIDAILQLRHYKQSCLSDARKLHLTRKTLCELVDFMTERKASDAEKQGRLSGSLAWRLERNETKIDFESYTWRPLDADLSSNSFIVRYSPSSDKYERVSLSGNVVGTIKDWHKGVSMFENIFRKEEKDWKMVYLSRIESMNTGDGKIEWTFNLDNCSKVIDHVNIKFMYETFQTGEVNIQICGENKNINFTNERELDTDDFKGTKKFSIVVILKGGEGSCAWQHSQLFRQSLSSLNYPFYVHVTLK